MNSTQGINIMFKIEPITSAISFISSVLNAATRAAPGFDRCDRRTDGYLPPALFPFLLFQTWSSSQLPSLIWCNLEQVHDRWWASTTSTNQTRILRSNNSPWHKCNCPTTRNGYKRQKTVKDELAAHKTLTDLLYDFLPTEMQISFQDNNEFPVIAKMLTDVEAKHGTMPEEVRLLLQSQLLTPLGHDEDPGPYWRYIFNHPKAKRGCIHCY